MNNVHMHTILKTESFVSITVLVTLRSVNISFSLSMFAGLNAHHDTCQDGGFKIQHAQASQYCGSSTSAA